MTTTTALRWQRTSLDDGSKEILTLVRITGHDTYLVEVCAGPNVGDDFIGLFTLDGDKIETPNNPTEWEAVTEAPDDAIGAVEEWECGNTTLERMTPEEATRGE